MKKVLSTIFIVLYSIVAVTVTVLLLSFNEYRCSEIAGYTFYIVSDDILEPDYVKGDLLIIEQSTDRSIQVGDKVFMYKPLSKQEYEIVCDTVAFKVQQGDRTAYQLQNGGHLDSSYLIGEVEDTAVYHNLGTVLGILESKWGYLFLVVIVSLLLFLQEVFELYMELKYGNDDQK